MNLHLERAGYSVRVDYRSFKAQGIDRHPTIHEGVFAIRMERRGRKSDRREINRTIFKDKGETIWVKSYRTILISASPRSSCWSS